MRKFERGWPWKSKGYSQYGAWMGRYESSRFPPGEKAYLERVPINQGGYDPGGAYWGITTPGGRGFLWGVYLDDGETTAYTRAWTRAEAKVNLHKRFPGIRFFR